MRYSIVGLLLVIAGCGGGGGGSSVQTSTSSQPASTTLIEGRVIDGYVSGATVFIDMNWSLAYEQGEPRTTTDSNGKYSFSQSDLAAFPCYQIPNDSRAIIVDVPAGAVDTIRGVVPAPYRMVYLPVKWLGGTSAAKNGVANVTPFTSLFAAAIAQGRNATTGASDAIIPVAESCGQQATQIAANVKTTVSDMGKVFLDAGVSLDSFYDDFIASGNTATRLKGEQIVDYLIRYKSISDLLLTNLQLEYGTSPGTFYGTYSFNSNSIRAIFTGDPQTVGFDLYSVAAVTPSSGQPFKFNIHLKGLRLRKDGVVITSSCQNSDPYSCPTISGTDAQALTKAATESIRTVTKLQGDQYVFSKNIRGNVFECEKNLKYRLVSNPTITSSATVTELEFEYKLPIDNKQSLYDCSVDEQGVRIAKRVEYTPRANGNNYSMFVYDVTSLDSTVTNNFPYAVSHFSQNIQTSTLDQTRIQAELNKLPTSPALLTDIAAKYPGRWYFETGSNTEWSILAYNLETDSFTCIVFSRSTNSILRQVEKTKNWQSALSMCYPDLSMF